MCGIVGAVAKDAVGMAYMSRMDKALDTLSLRGPDSHGREDFGPVSLGQTRLSIIDTSVAAKQPFTDPSGNFTIVFNGEIYNYRELIPELTDFRPTSASDTEVLLHLYMQKGEAMLSMLNGFFAFAILDRAKSTFFLARDRMGIKPLLVFEDAHVMAFASEYKALLSLGIERQLDTASLGMYLQFNYTPYPDTILKGVTELEPGTWRSVTFGERAERNRIGSFFIIPREIKNTLPSYPDAVAEVRRLLEASVQLRMVADVPLGAFLSGGVDSSIIVRIASPLTPHLRTFSIGYKDEPLFDESAHAHEVASHCGTQHEAFMLSNDDLYADLGAVLDYIDRPFADSSALAVHILSRHTRKHVTVALSGDGADELFGGYNKHEAELRARKPQLLEKAVIALGPLWQALPSSRNSALGNRVRQLRKFAHAAGLNPKERYWQWASFMPEAQAKDMLLHWAEKDEREYQLREQRLMAAIRPDGDLCDVLHTDLHQVLRNDMLTKVDLMSMANSLEVRVPFLDHRLVSYVNTLPAHYRIRRGERKRLLRDAFGNDLPATVFNRPKHGFEVPLLKWFRTELRPMITDELLSPALIKEQGIFVPERIKELIDRVMGPDPGDSATHIWNLIVFQRWWLRYMKN